MSIVFIFLDGVGLAPAGHDNPLTDAATPSLRALLGGPLTIEQARPETGDWGLEASLQPPASSLQPPVLLKPIDATLGVEGLPQSGTGHTALLAGVNAAALHGRHQQHFPPVALRGLLAERSIFRRAAARGGRATFANAFGPGYWEAVAAGRIRRSASVIAAEGAGLRFRDGADLRAGRALAWDVTGAAMRARGIDAPLVAPRDAGANLARLAADHDLVFYESFLPDLAGHGRLSAPGRHGDGATERQPIAPSPRRPVTPSFTSEIHIVMSLLDELIGGALAALRPKDTLLITSDHGNIESAAEPVHTRNPVPLLAVGPGAPAFAAVASIAEIANAIDRATG